ncbi:hypothetical protein [Cystobacter fuscus]|uniref:hypothetical protein n=1 Tax=Cystobacter fuscus TaxID=43 RepID=UPI0037C18753
MDVLIIEEGEVAGRQPRVETFSFKSRDLSGLDLDGLRVQMIEDAGEALRKYGETLDTRRDSLQSLLSQGRMVSVSRVRLVYEGNGLMPGDSRTLNRAVSEARAEVPEVEVLFQ